MIKFVVQIWFRDGFRLFFKFKGKTKMMTYIDGKISAINRDYHEVIDSGIELRKIQNKAKKTLIEFFFSDRAKFLLGGEK